MGIVVLGFVILLWVLFFGGIWAIVRVSRRKDST